MLQRMWTLHSSIKRQRKYYRGASYLDTMKYCKQYLDVCFPDVFPRLGIWCQHSKLHSLPEKPDYLRNKSKVLCYSAKRNTSDLNSCYSILQHNRLVSELNMKNTPWTSSLRPYFQIRHISGQSGVETFGAWTHVYLWLSESTPVGCAQDLLLYVHNSTGLPWWTTIILATVLLRTVVTLPLAMYQVCSTKRYKQTECRIFTFFSFFFNLVTASELQTELFVGSYCAELWIDGVDLGTCIRNWFLNIVQTLCSCPNCHINSFSLDFLGLHLFWITT